MIELGKVRFLKWLVVIAYEWVVWFILLLPLGGFLVIGLVGRRLPEGGGPIAVGAMAGSFVLSMYWVIQVLQQGGRGGALVPRKIRCYAVIPLHLPRDATYTS